VLEVSTVARRRGGRWRLRDWRLRTKLTAVLLIPLALAGVLGALRITDLARKADESTVLARQIGFAQQLGVAVHALQGERYRVATIQAGDRGGDPTELARQMQRVDSAVASLRAADVAVKTFPAATREQWGPAYRATLPRLSGLAALRLAARTAGAPGSLRGAVPGDVNSRTAIAAYSGLIALLLDLDRQALSDVGDTLAHQADGIKALAVAQEQASWQDAVLQTGILTEGLSTEQQVALRTADARFEAAAAEFGQVSTPAQRQFSFMAGPVTERKRLLDDALGRAVRGVPLEAVPGGWNTVASATAERIWQGRTTLLGTLRHDAGVLGETALREAYWDGAVIGLLLLLAVALLILVVRSLLQPLRALRTAAFDVADRRLPAAVEQLSSADGVPAETKVDPVPVHSREEVGQVARAFDTVHVQAVRLAAEQAKLRSCLNDVFLSLSERNQDLLERQLQLIHQARAKVADLELGSRLDQLTGLATRMRRHNESLLVVAGGTRRPGAEAPVAVGEVLSAAVAEIEDQARVSVRPPPAATVNGLVVSDLAHLIAELLDNATSATPPGANVTVGGSLTEDNSLLVEITDSGAGLSADALATINARLASALTVDPTDPPAAGQVGLFVVRELAAQHGITVRLRQRTTGSGILATVLVPATLVDVNLRVPTVPPSYSGGGEAPDPVMGASEMAEPSGWIEGQDQPPLQVSVVDRASGTDLFSPASINPGWLAAGTTPSGRPRTVQEEWLELFGSETRPDCQAKYVPVAEPTGGGTWGLDALTLDGLEESTGLAEPLRGIPEASESHEVREEIFEMVSAWFREQQLASINDSPSTQSDWQSSFDEGWQAAQALRTPLDHGLTESGLPKRQPRAHLVPGADSPAVSILSPAALIRAPEDVRDRLSRYQRGLRVGRHARLDPGEQFARTNTLARHLGDDSDDYGPAEEHQQ
jgi:signal transduction histidine kinase